MRRAAIGVNNALRYDLWCIQRFEAPDQVKEGWLRSEAWLQGRECDAKGLVTWMAWIDSARPDQGIASARVLIANIDPNHPSGAGTSTTWSLLHFVRPPCALLLNHSYTATQSRAAPLIPSPVLGVETRCSRSQAALLCSLPWVLEYQYGL
jgi:hypothetical protein